MTTIGSTSAVLSWNSVPIGLSKVFYLPGTPGGSNADATDMLARFRAGWVAMQTRMSTSLTLTFDATSLMYNDANGDLVGAFTGIPGSPLAGTDANDPLPLQTQGFVQWNTAGVVNSRRVRGRTYMPGPTENSNVNGTVTAGYITALAAFASAYLAAGSTASVPVVWHRPGPAGAGSSFPITGSVARGVWAVLRSRRD